MRLGIINIMNTGDDDPLIFDQIDGVVFPWRRAYCVNLSKIREIEPWFNNTYVLRLRDLEFRFRSVAVK